ncbi:cytochrome P450 3A24-like isoform X2 [Patiria miniata]|uniref:Thromboxane-A synthase n=1 Tax=Patiria miniata TaxID=46514 RepID=A0A914ANZ0_PATMI|nr:cytochrome P450 3A24-like isoform X2 [Patiria miniata]
MVSKSQILMLGKYACYDWWCHQYFQRRGVPVADYIPIFGSSYKFSEGFHLAMEDFVKEKGKVVGMYEFRRPILLINDPDVIKKVLVKNFNHFCNRRVFPLLIPPLTRGLSMLANEEWKDVRNILSPTFSAVKMKKMSVLINECCERLVSGFDRAQEGGTPVECRELFGGYTLDVIARCGFGLQVNVQDKDDPFVNNAKKVFDFGNANPGVALAMVFPPLVPLLKWMNVTIVDQSAIDYLKEVAEEALKMRKEGEGTSKNIDLLQLMLNAHNDTELDQGDVDSVVKSKGKGTRQHKPLSNEDVQAQAITFFTAGMETTSTLLSLTAYLLAMNQDIQEKLHAEIDNLAPTGDSLGYDVIPKMEYLDMVISESLRLYPPAVFLERLCNETIRLDEFTVEKGLCVFVSIWALHYSPEYWQNPAKFDPERFSAENKANIKPCTYMPFGFGPRNCIAMRFALLETKMALVHVMQKFRFDVCSKTEIPPTLSKYGFISPKSVLLSAVPRI